MTPEKLKETREFVVRLLHNQPHRSFPFVTLPAPLVLELCQDLEWYHEALESVEDRLKQGFREGPTALLNLAHWLRFVFVQRGAGYAHCRESA